MKIKVELILDIDTDLESVEDVMNHVVFDEILGPNDDVVSVDEVSVSSFSKV